MLNANTSQIGLIPSCILSISVDGGRPENRTIISEALAGSINLQSLFEANNLDPDRVHVVNVTTAEFKSTDGSPSSFSLLGFVYSPAFGTLEDGERIMTTWRDNGEELAPSDEKYTTDLLPDPSPTGGPPDHSTNNEGPPIAPIAGGVVGVVAFLVLVGLIFWLRRRRNLARRQAPVRDGEQLFRNRSCTCNAQSSSLRGRRLALRTVKPKHEPSSTVVVPTRHTIRKVIQRLVGYPVYQRHDTARTLPQKLRNVRIDMDAQLWNRNAYGPFTFRVYTSHTVTRRELESASRLGTTTLGRASTHRTYNL